jgi:hypothetical protein
MNRSALYRPSLANCVALAALSLTSVCRGQTPAPAPTSQATASSIAQGSTFDISAGFTNNFAKNTYQGYYNVAINGFTLDSYGTAPTFVKLSTSGLADVSKYSYFMNVTQGATTYGGQLLQAAKVFNLPQSIGALSNFNLVLGANTLTDSISSSTYTAGIEQAKPTTFEFLSSVLPGVNGYAVFGFGDERLSQAATAGSTATTTTDQYGPTVRGIVGRQWFLLHRTYNDKTTENAINAYKADYSQVKDMKAVIDYRDAHRNDWQKNYTPAQRVTALVALIDVYNTAARASNSAVPTQEKWDDAVTAELKLLQQWLVDVPDFVVWADGNARYALGDVQGGRLRSVYSLNAKFYFNPIDPNSPYIQAQFLNGFQEATPTARSNEFQVLLGFHF